MKKTLIKVLGLIVCLLLIGCTEEQLKTRYTVEWIGFNDVMIEKKIYNEGSKLIQHHQQLKDILLLGGIKLLKRLAKMS